MSVFDFKLTNRPTDKKWTEVAKKSINAIIDYASKTNKFSTVRIGEWAEVDELPGFYITFPGLDSQGRIAFVRTGHVYTFDCKYAVKGSDYQEALQELLEVHGEMLAKLDEDHDMAGVPNGVPEVGVAEVHDVDIIGFATGSDAGRTAQSHEYLYGATVIKVKAKMNLRG
jgi:hypothetical protein